MKCVLLIIAHLLRVPVFPGIGDSATGIFTFQFSMTRKEMLDTHGCNASTQTLGPEL